MNEKLTPIIKKVLEHPILAIFAFFQFFFVILLIVTLLRHTNRVEDTDQGPVDYFNVNITNIDSKINNISEETKDSIESMLSNIINLNTEHSLTNIDATIKDKSFHYHKLQQYMLYQIHYSSLI